MALRALGLATSVFAVAAKPATPHIVFMLADDLGYGIPGWGGNPTQITPALDALRRDGLTMTENHVYQFCSPTRGALLTGRYPWKLPQSIYNFLPATYLEGTPIEYHMLPAKLAEAGYVSHHIGKWHLGLYAPQFTPLGRGFNTTYGFLTGGEDHFTQAGDVGANCPGAPNGGTVYDLWSGNATAPQWEGDYTATRFNAVAADTIAHHAERYGADTPMFMYYALHNTHAPIEAIPEFEALYPNVSYPLERTFYAMVSTVDSAVGNVTAELKAAGMWDDTLFVWMTDNGSPIQVAGSNAPLRGVKGSNWEGGTRTPAAVSGGVLPPAQHGQTTAGQAHVVDWYATILGLAGLNASDPFGPDPTLDSLDLWPWISGANATSPRTETVLDHCMSRNITTGALRVGDWKLIVGGSFSGGKNWTLGEWAASWYGTFSPNASFAANGGTDYYACPPAHPCLYNVTADPGEHVDLSAQEPAVLAQLMSRFVELEQAYHPPTDRGQPETKQLCAAAEAAAQPGAKIFVTPWRAEPAPPSTAVAGGR